jgi:hypothetical protein
MGSGNSSTHSTAPYPPLLTTDAYETLSDPARRTAYDARLAARRAPPRECRHREHHEHRDREHREHGHGHGHGHGQGHERPRAQRANTAPTFAFDGVPMWDDEFPVFPPHPFGRRRTGGPGPGPGAFGAPRGFGLGFGAGAGVGGIGVGVGVGAGRFPDFPDLHEFARAHARAHSHSHDPFKMFEACDAFDAFEEFEERSRRREPTRSQTRPQPHTASRNGQGPETLYFDPFAAFFDDIDDMLGTSSRTAAEHVAAEQRHVPAEQQRGATHTYTEEAVMPVPRENSRVSATSGHTPSLKLTPQLDKIKSRIPGASSKEYVIKDQDGNPVGWGYSASWSSTSTRRR